MQPLPNKKLNLLKYVPVKKLILDVSFVKFAVDLSPGPSDCVSFGPVEHFELDSGLVAGPTTKPVQSVDLFDQVAFANPAKTMVQMVRPLLLFQIKKVFVLVFCPFHPTKS